MENKEIAKLIAKKCYSPDIEPEDFAWEAWQAARRWIPVEEELPENWEEVLISIGGALAVGYRLGEYWWMVSSQGTHPLGMPAHWQPLPEPPEDWRPK